MLDFDATIRGRVYEITLARGVPPSIAELARASECSTVDAAASLRRLAAARIVVLQERSGELLMVPPFSALPTPFIVETPSHSSYANCAWDALGVAVMMRQNARVLTGCGCCAQPSTLDVDLEAPPTSSLILHFAVPAARWWEDIVYT